jgi:hypothetical protein
MHIDAAVTVAELAVAAADEDVKRRLAESNLSLIPRERWSRLHRGSDLDDAVAAAERAVDVGPSPDGMWAMALSNWGIALRMRSREAGDRADLDNPARLSTARTFRAGRRSHGRRPGRRSSGAGGRACVGP